MQIKHLIIFLIFFTSGFLYAHPHVYIDTSVQIICTDFGVKEFVQHWEFDEMFSESLITDYDKDGDGNFNEKESKALYSGAFINLKNYAYFTHIKIDGKSYKFDKVESFKAEIDNGIVLYEFTVPCNTKLTAANRKLSLSIYDPSYYCDVSPMNKNSVSFQNAENIIYTSSLIENKQNTFYYGQIVPQELVITMRLKNAK